MTIKRVPEIKTNTVIKPHECILSKKGAPICNTGGTMTKMNIPLPKDYNIIGRIK